MTIRQSHILAAYLLKMAADRFSDDVCGDLDLRKIFPDVAEATEISDFIADSRGDTLSHSPFTQDWSAMETVANILLGIDEGGTESA